MNWKIFVGLRYLTRRSKERFISVVSVISVFGVIVGVAALIVVISIMTGFDEEIKEKIIGTYAHIVVLKEGGIADEKKIDDILSKNKHVIASAPFIDEPAFLRYRNKVLGVLVRGLDERRERRVNRVEEYLDTGSLNFRGKGVFLGKELFRALRLQRGDSISLFSPDGKRKDDFVVLGTFSSGRYDYDANFVFISLRAAKTLFGSAAVSGIGIKVDNEFNVSSIKTELKKTLGYPFIVKTWMDLDKNLMRALAIEKKMMFIILGLIIVVACFNIASSLIMQVLEKTKDIGILRAIGATAEDIKDIFIFLGFSTGFLGMLLGGVLGVVIANNINAVSAFIERLTGFSLFPSDIYYLNEIPVKIIPSDILYIALFSLVLAVLAAFYPAWKAARLNPVEAIRYE